MSRTLDSMSLDIIFREARTHNAWADKPVSDGTLTALYDLMKWGPTSANCSPARIIFVKSKEAKAKLATVLSEGNLEKSMQAPVTAVIGYDVEFYERLPELFPHQPEAKTWSSFAFASFDFTKMMRAGEQLALVGPHFIRS